MLLTRRRTNHSHRSHLGFGVLVKCHKLSSSLSIKQNWSNWRRWRNTSGETRNQWPYLHKAAKHWQPTNPGQKIKFVSHLLTRIARFLEKKPSSSPFRMDCNNKNKFLCYLYMKERGQKATTNLWRRAEQRIKADVHVPTVSSGWAGNFQTIEVSPRLLESACELNSASDRSENPVEVLGLWAISNHVSLFLSFSSFVPV